jgi:cytochrome P450
MSPANQPPGPTGLPVVGTNYHYARDPFEFMTAVGRAYGDVARFTLGRRETYMLSNPRDVKRVLVDDSDRFVKAEFGDDAIDRLLGRGLLLSEGEFWRRQRERIQPSFAPDRIQAYAGEMASRAAALADRWEPGEVVPLDRELARLTVGVIAAAMFDVDLTRGQVHAVERALHPIGDRFEPDPRRVVVPSWLPTPETRRFEDAVETLDAVVDELVRARRAEGADGDDMLSTLVRDHEAGDLDYRTLRDEVVTMLLAGHDTTALALTYAWWLLADHPGADARLADELAGLDGPPTAGDARELEYTERVISESMRLYPPVYALFREPTEDVTLADYDVPAGSAVMLPQWVVHRDPAHWDDPESFDPDRWLPERSAGRPEFAYFPFGGGPRVCIGRRFATMEAKIVLATVARRYRLERARDDELELQGSITMHPREPMEMRVRER